MSDKTSKATVVFGGLDVVIANLIFFEFARDCVSCFEVVILIGY